MKRLLLLLLLVLPLSSWTNRTLGQKSTRLSQIQDTNTRAPSQRPSAEIPFVTEINPREAPSGTVIQLTIQSRLSNADDLKKGYRLTIGGVSARFYPIYKNDVETIAAIVPDKLNIQADPKPGASIPLEVVFLDLRDDRPGIPYDQFKVLIPTGLKGKVVQIDEVRNLTSRDYDVTFNDYIPPELWPKVTIYFDGKAVEKILKMNERSFTVELPYGVSQSNFNIFAKVGEFETLPRRYEAGVLVALKADPSPIPSATPTTTALAQVQSPSNAILFVILGLGSLVGVSVLAFNIYRRWRLKSQPVPIAGPPDDDVEELHLPDELPADLVNACVTGECVLYAGSGLSAQSGLPVWKDFVVGLLKWARSSNFITDNEEALYLADVERGQADPVADSLVSRLTTDSQKESLNAYLQKVFLGRSSPSPLHSKLKPLNFSAALTTNFDNLLESVYRVSSDEVFTPRDSDRLLSALTRRGFFILKLYGTLERKDTVMVASYQYEEAITSNTLFSQFMQTLFFSRTLLFLGASLEGIEAYLRGITLPKSFVRTHYALVAVTGGAWRAKAELLERRYGIKVFPYTPKDDFSDLSDFLTKLTDAVAAPQATVATSTRKVSRLKRVTLENIGPFEHLSLDLDLSFDHAWHIFLGDNGVGKSTVLKAIALALCGQEAQPYAGRLLRDLKKTDKVSLAKKTSGTITLETDNGTSYVTTIERDVRTGQVEIISNTARPLEAEGWLAIGFPPLRTTSWEPPKGPDPDADLKKKSRPVVSDLLPLVTGDVDPRLDKLKQWIVNLDYEDIKDPSSNNHYRKVIQKVFDIIGSVAEGMRLKYNGVGEGKRILIETENGTLIPLEGLSQGTISLIGWIGILMQRLNEVFEDDDPTKRYALVLMDEIDAHMHPMWQRTLVTHLKEQFPNAQFIASTHSPLVVCGLPAGQVVRFAKDDNGKAVILPIAPDMTLGYTDQILTSMLFNLPTTLDATTEKQMEDYDKLDQMADLGDQKDEHERLRQELIARVPPRTATYQEKHEEMLAKAKMLKEAGLKLKELSPEGSATILARANHLLASLGEETDNDPS